MAVRTAPHVLRAADNLDEKSPIVEVQLCDTRKTLAMSRVCGFSKHPPPSSSCALCLFGSARVFELMSRHMAMLLTSFSSFSTSLVVLVSLLQCISGILLLRVRDRSGRLLWLAFMMQLLHPPAPMWLGKLPACHILNTVSSTWCLLWLPAWVLGFLFSWEVLAWALPVPQVH